MYDEDTRSGSPVSTTAKLFPIEIDRLLRKIFPGFADNEVIKRTVDILAKLRRHRQNIVIHWIEVASHSAFELAFRLAEHAPEALDRLDRATFDGWVAGAIDRYDRIGRDHAFVYLRDLDGFMQRQHNAAASASLAANEERLMFLLQALEGRSLRLKVAKLACTNGETIYLPVEIAAYADPAANRRLYKVLTILLWAQVHYGTFDAAAIAPLQELIGNHGPNRVMSWLEAFEAVRLEACLARELPGLARDIEKIREPWPQVMARVLPLLRDPNASVLTSLELVKEYVGYRIDAPIFPHAGSIDLATALRISRSPAPVDAPNAINAPTHDGAQSGADGNAELDELSLGENVAASAGDTHASSGSSGEAGNVRVMVQDYEFVEEEPESADPPDFVYDEWDFRRHAYRRNWCQLYEVPVEPGDAAYVAAVQARYHHHIKQIHRQLEIIRGEDRIIGRQFDGEDMDLDAIVESYSERRTGGESALGLFRRRTRRERSMSVMFMVDMSGSTKGWVNDVEREALVILCEAVERLGDNAAIYGFSGWGHSRCEVYPIKRFGEAYGDEVRARIAGIEARNFTRMGVAVRHLSRLLLEQPTRHKLLITISDGHPDDDGDDYRSKYGIEDTRRALLEAHERGVRSFCITIDRQGADYLETMYGPARYEVIDDPQKLPLRVADIYRHLSS